MRLVVPAADIATRHFKTSFFQSEDVGHHSHLLMVPVDLSFTFTHTSLVTQNSLYQTFTHLQQLYI